MASTYNRNDDDDDDDDDDAQAAIPQREAYEHYYATQCSQRLIKALRDYVFPDEATEKMFGIVKNDTANGHLGDLMYYAWTEIYLYHLSKANEDMRGPPGPASDQFQTELTKALVQANLAPKFRHWVAQVVLDHSYRRDLHCQEVLGMDLNFGMYIHPNSEIHHGWMDRLQAEFGTGRPGRVLSPTSTARYSDCITGTSSRSTGSKHLCEYCGVYGAASRCASCKEVSYCSKDHQKLDWKNHKTSCKAIAANPVCVFVEVGEGEGMGLCNRRTNHIFASKADGLDHIEQQFGPGNASPPLRAPFGEMNGWKVEIYCNLEHNRVDTNPMSSGRPPATAFGRDPSRLNAAGVYLGSDWRAGGMTHYTNLAGTIFVLGRNEADGRPLHANVLEGLLVFISEAMDLYGDGMSDASIVGMLRRWASQYQAGVWNPADSDDDDDDDSRYYYSTEYTQGALDHR